jgi:general secretion pathway protein B
MSLILDALKKSEKSRHDDASSVLPLIVKPRRASRNKQKKFPLLPLTIILVALAALFLVYLLSGDAPRSPEPTITSVPEENARQVEEAPPEPVLKEPEQEAAPAAEEALADDSATSAESTTLPVEPPQAPVQQEPADVAARQQILQQTGILSTRDTTSVPPRLSKIPGGLRKEVAPLRLDFHVYSTDRPRRIVFINGQEYREGMNIRNNLKLVRIVPEGAVMEWKGREFLLTVRD